MTKFFPFLLFFLLISLCRAAGADVMEITGLLYPPAGESPAWEKPAEAEGEPVA